MLVYNQSVPKRYRFEVDTMRITQEADYALRITYLLAKTGQVLDAGTISTEAGVTERFTVKILRKLVSGGIVSSKKGSKGGYGLSVEPSEVSMRRVVELIDGPLEISRCLDSGYECTRTGDLKNKCTFHLIFAKINQTIAEKMDSVTLDTVIGDDFEI